MGVFALFLLITTSQVRAGATDCGCFGSTKVNPVGTLVLDIGVLVSLLALRPRWQGWPHFGPEGALVFRATLAAALLVGGVAAFAHFRYGSVSMGVARASGEPVSVVEKVVDLGRVPVGGREVGTVVVLNASTEPVQVGWASARCRCVTFLTLPVDIPANTSAELAFEFHAPSKPTPFRVAVALQTSVGEVQFTVTGQVVEKP